MKSVLKLFQRARNENKGSENLVHAKLVNDARSNSSAVRAKALRKLYQLAEQEQYREPLCHHSLRLLPTIKSILETDDDQEVRANACRILWYLSRSYYCRAIIGSSEIAIMPTIIAILLKAKGDEEYRSFLCAAIGNIVMEKRTHQYMISPEVGWLSCWKQELIKRPDDYLVYCAISNFTNVANNESVTAIIDADFHRIFIERLMSSGSNPLKWKNRQGGVEYWILTFAMDLSCLPAGTIAIRELNKLPFFLELMEYDSLEGIKATIVVSNVYGKDENSAATQAVLVNHESSLRLLLEVLEVQIHYDEKDLKLKKLRDIGFFYGIFSLLAITSALKHLSISDENKRVMMQYPIIIKLASDLLLAFINNAEEYAQYDSFALVSIGGGGKDFETLHHSLELLLQLSFYYDDEKSLQSSFVVDGYDMRRILQDLLNLPPDRNVSYEAKQFASTLLARLQPKLPLADISKGPSQGRGDGIVGQHVMLSYSWANNKSYVVALGKKLREMGYDVWRDEEGSSILPPMSGDIVEAMAAAIQYSYMVIVFVSPEYKESANCRAEAGYAQARVQNSDLHIAYVMVDRNYHTRSTPRSVDGWLGFMVGSSLWYPLWEESHVDSTARGLAGLIGDHAKLSDEKAVLKISSISVTERTTPSSPTSPNSPTTLDSTKSKESTSEGLDFDRAWDCLKPGKCIDASALKALLEDELGIFDQRDFEGLERKYYEQIALLLKPAPQTHFRRALKL